MPTNLPDFARLGLQPALLDAIAVAGYVTPTPIQNSAIPLVLEGGDLFATAQTGTGKTAAYSLPILQRLSDTARGRAKPGNPRCLVLAPTRELAVQIMEAVTIHGQNLPLKYQVVFGGVNINRQRMAMRKPVDMLIATPGRLLDLIEHKIVRLTDVDILVLDEADRMLDMGFFQAISRILSMLPKQRQSLLFSATFSNEIKKLAHSLLSKPHEVSLAPLIATTELVEQSVYFVDKSRKRALLAKLIKDHGWSQVLVFTKTRKGANHLVGKLGKSGIEALAIHADKSQAARTAALENFKTGSLPVLVATDLAARGIEIENLPSVVNYELPHASRDYIHRIGRTGRAGNKGQAISLVIIDEVKQWKAIEKLVGISIPVIECEGFTGHAEALGSTVVERGVISGQRRARKKRSDPPEA